jgi:undecaprenyl-diphosphatase
LNQNIFLYINSIAGQNSFLDNSAILFGEYMPYLFIFAEVILYFYMKFKNEAIFAFYSMLFSMFFSYIIGIIYFHNRPFMDGIGTLLSSHDAGTSFPSDHTTFMLAIAFSLFLYQKSKKIGIILIVLGIVSGFCRIIEGIHYPFDILGGIILGLLSAFFVFKINSKLEPLNKLIIKFI